MFWNSLKYENQILRRNKWNNSTIKIKFEMEIKHNRDIIMAINIFKLKNTPFIFLLKTIFSKVEAHYANVKTCWTAFNQPTILTKAPFA